MRTGTVFFSLVALSWREAIRNPFGLLITLTVIILTLMLPLGFSHTLGDTARRLARDGGLAFHLLGGLALAAYAAGALAGSGRHRATDSLLLSKPVSPPMLFLARTTAVFALLAIFSLSSALATLLADRIAEAFTPRVGYQADITTAIVSLGFCILALTLGGVAQTAGIGHFPSTALALLPVMLAAAAGLSGFYDRDGSRLDAYTLQFSAEVLPASLRMMLALLLIAALAQTLSLRLRAMTVAMVCVGLLAAGLAAEWIIMSLPRYPLHHAISGLLSLLPNWRWFLTRHADETGMPVSGILAYAAAYAAAVLTAGCAITSNREHAG